MSGRRWTPVPAGNTDPLRRLRSWARADETPERRTSGGYRLAAYAALAIVTGAYLSTLYGIVAVVGGTETFLLVVAAALSLGVLLGATLRRRVAILLALVLLALGLVGYVIALPPASRAGLTPVSVLEDTLAMLTGFSAIQLVAAGMWATAVAPGPTFLAWFFAAREEFGYAAGVAGLTLGFFVLTGDAGTTVTLAGVLASAATVAFGTIARLGGGREQLETLAAVFAVVILASAIVSAVPGGGASPLRIGGGGGVQNDLVSGADTVGVGGTLRLSPEVRFTVEADRGDYWRVAPFDRFTGARWIQTGAGSDPVVGSLDRPLGDRDRVRQEFEAVAPLAALPAAAEPYRLEGVDARIDQLGGLSPAETLTAGERYTVISLVRADRSSLEFDRTGASETLPPEDRDRYTQLPENTPAAVGQLAANVTATATTRTEAASAVERWLEANREYSLTVPEPSGNIANQFLFDLEAGYCVYFATTMVSMLRSQDVPARYVVGYTPGQRVGDEEWVVRGLDAHAWVEVFVPGAGWVRFDPTPAGPRRAAEDERLAEAREAGSPDVDIDGSENRTYVPPTTTLPPLGTVTRPIETGGTIPPDVPAGPGGNRTVSNRTSGATNGTATTATGATATGARGPPGAGGDDGPPFRLPAPETIALWALLVVGLAAGARRTGLADRAYRALWVRVQPRGAAPARVVDGAYERVLYVLGRRTRERRRGETVREYLEAVDADGAVREVVELRERARYAGEVGEEEAARARSLAADIVRRDRPGDSV